MKEVLHWLPGRKPDDAKMVEALSALALVAEKYLERTLERLDDWWADAWSKTENWSEEEFYLAYVGHNAELSITFAGYHLSFRYNHNLDLMVWVVRNADGATVATATHETDEGGNRRWGP